MRSMYLALSLGSAMLFAAGSSARADTQMWQELGRTVPGFESAGSGHFAVADFDGDGADDFALSAASGTALIEIIGKEGGAFQVKQIILLEDEDIVRLLMLTRDDSPRLFTVAVDGAVREYGGWPLQQMRRIDLGIELGPSYLSSAAIGDVDGDGDDELVVISDNWSGHLLNVYDLTTGILEWSSPDFVGRNILLRQMDADPALEIVVGGTPGYILDGATHAVDWSYKDGFGVYLAAGRFQPTGGAQFLAASPWLRFTAFQGEPYSPLWDVPVSYDISALAAADLDGDGMDEILQGDGQWGEIKVYDARTREIRLSIPNRGWGVSAIAAADFDRSGNQIIAFSPYQAMDSESWIRFVDPRDGSTLWNIPSDQTGPYAPITVGITGGNGRSVLLYGAQGANRTRLSASEIDALTGAPLWTSTPDGNDDSYAFTPSAVRIAHRANGEHRIVFAGTGFFEGRLLALEGSSHGLAWWVGSYNGGPMSDQSVTDLAAIDLDADGNDEIVVCTNGSSGNQSGNRLFIFSSDDGSELWRSVTMGNSFEPCKGVLAGRFDASPGKLVAAVLPTSIRAFDATTHLLAWTLPVTADGATLLNGGQGDREIAVFAGPRLSFYDGATRTLLRQFDMPAPVDAVREFATEDRLLVVAAGGRLHLVDSSDGVIAASSGFLGSGLGAGNQLAVQDLGGGTWLVGAGSRAGVFRYLVRLTDGIFTDGFDPEP